MRIIRALILCMILLSCSSTSESNRTAYSDDSVRAQSLDKEKGFYNPVFEPVLADPTVILDTFSNTFYAYGTEDDWDDGEKNKYIPILRSTNLIDWKYVGNVFDRKPSWKSEGGLWAPDINKIDDKYLIYYAYSTWGDKNPGIGIAVSGSPEGPFTDRGKLFDSEDIKVPNSIDPFLFIEGFKKYLFWGSFSDRDNQGTYVIELAEDGQSIKNATEKIKIAAGDFEAVMIYRRNDYYYFFGSKGSCCDGAESSYHVLAARSDSLFGPYLDKDGREILERGSGTPVLKGSDRFKGPGHVSNIVKDADGVEWILYHAINSEYGKLTNGTSRRILMLGQVTWEDEWPVIGDKTPRLYSEIKPRF